MISIVYSTRKENPEFKEYLKKTCGGIKNIEILEYVNNGEKSLTEIYNDGIEKSNNDIVVFTHDDILFNKNGWGRKIISHFKNSEYGILGVAGTTSLPDSGKWWEEPSKMVGIVDHTHLGKTWTSQYSGDFNNKILDVVIVDGLFFAIHKDRIKEKFDEQINGFHFYDIDFCFSNTFKGVKVGVMFDIRLTHKSIGETNDEWESNRKLFVLKHNNALPFNLRPKIIIDKDKKGEIKKQPKVSIVIPTKNKEDLLFKCIDSIFEKSDYKNYEIIVADTGSDETNKQQIKNYCAKNNVKLVEYDYYNFGQINNDIVFNHTSDDSELLLFCNNDIELINDSITLMVRSYIKNKKDVGTIGCRLHYGNNTIQHAGILMWVENMKVLHVSHRGLNSAYNYDNKEIRDIVGNTGAFLMINRDLFKNIGGFNEKYIECFEDVELNIKCILNNKKNIFVGNAICYHYESQTRNDDKDKMTRLHIDYNQRLAPLVQNNLDKMAKYLIIKS